MRLKHPIFKFAAFAHTVSSNSKTLYINTIQILSSLSSFSYIIFLRKVVIKKPEKKNMKTVVLCCCLVLFFLGFQDCVQGRLLLGALKPDRDDVAAYARWLVSQNSWGILNTISIDLEGSPFGNVVSFSDGVPNKGTGVPYFYLTTLDPTARNAIKDQRSSLAISEYPLGTCGKADPESPVCAKITLTGKLVLVDANSKEAEFAQNALFTKHPEMKGWPKGHNFRIFKLEIEDIFMINWFGGPKPLTVDQYLKYQLNKFATCIWKK